MNGITLGAREEAARRALADYKAVAGKIIEVLMISGYNKENDSVDVYDVPIRVRVHPNAREDDVLDWVDNFLDPYWDVTPIGEYPEIAGLRSFWTFGKSYRVNGNEVIEEPSALPDLLYQRDCHCSAAISVCSDAYLPGVVDSFSGQQYRADRR